MLLYKQMNKKILDYEQKNLKKVQNIIDSNIKVLLSKISNSNESIQQALEYINSNKLDSIEKRDMFSLINNKHEIVSTLTRSKDFLIRIKPKPFFAKIVFSEDGCQEETYYVGLKNIKNNNNEVVIDWRVPVASLLYFSSLGKTSYDAPIGKINVNLLLKRQFRLIPDKIVSYIDTDTKIDDNFLQDILSQNTTYYMHNIVQSIQEEQNSIIRRPPQQSVIIDGIAGSGKTSIAMHRISYILYCDKGKTTSKNVLVVSPNKLFSSYISELLPELGEENVTTFSISQIFQEAGLAPITHEDKLSMIESEFTNGERFDEINLKFSVNFFDEVENFLKNFDVTPYIDNALHECGCNIPNSLYSKINIPKTSNLKVKFLNTLHMVLVKTFQNLPNKYLENYEKKATKILKTLINPKLIFYKLYNEKNLKYGIEKLGYEDVSIFAYITYKLYGATTNKSIYHVFVDEMQDYDPFSIYLLRELFPNAVMTFAGDSNQNILSLQSNIEMIKRILPHVNIDKLDTSYRSTNEIISFAQKILGKNYSAKIVRHGDQPLLTKYHDLLELQNHIMQICEKHPNDKIAIITKNIAEAYKLSKYLTKFNLILNEEDEAIITSNRIITTTFLSKGLEYDRVIIPFVNKSNYNNDIEKQNLYVACTRSLHGLYLFYNEEPSVFLINENKT